MVLKQKRKIIKSAIRKKNPFVLDTKIGKVTLIKRKSRLTYLFNENSQIKFWYRRLEYASNARVVQTSKLTDSIDIIIDEGQKEDYRFSSNF